MRWICLISMALMVEACAVDTEREQTWDRTAGLSQEEIQQGFLRLFDGKTVNGWQGATEDFVAGNGVLLCKGHRGGNLYTTQQYSDFILRFEFRLTPGANSGVAIRAPRWGTASKRGMEIQILDDTAPKNRNLRPYQYHGSIYGLIPAERGHLKPVGEWNSQEIFCWGRRVRVTLNAVVIVDADLDEIGVKAMDGRDHPGRFRKKGYVGLLGHGSQVEFRNIRLKESQR